MISDTPGLWPYLPLLAYALQWIVIGLGAAWVWLRKPGQAAERAVAELGAATKKEISDMEDRTERTAHGITQRLTILEERIRHMPTSEDIERLAEGMGDIRERVAATAQRSEQHTLQLNRIESYLLSNKR